MEFAQENHGRVYFDGSFTLMPSCIMFVPLSFSAIIRRSIFFSSMSVEVRPWIARLISQT